MRILRLLTLLTASLLGVPCVAGEFVAVGRVEQITLLPEGTKRCPPDCPIDASGRTVCVSNSCGCAEAVVQIDRVLIGANRPNVLVKYRLGEWCEPEFPLDNAEILIRLSEDGPPQWSELTPLEAGNDFGFSTSAFEYIGPVDVGSLASDDGVASLGELERRLVPGHSINPAPDSTPRPDH